MDRVYYASILIYADKIFGIFTMDTYTENNI